MRQQRFRSVIWHQTCGEPMSNFPECRFIEKALAAETLVGAVAENVAARASRRANLGKLLLSYPQLVIVSYICAGRVK